MAIAGTGIMPAAGAVYTELAAMTLPAYSHTLVVQLYKASPNLQALMTEAVFESGGMGIRQPVQGTKMTTPEWIGYDGRFAAPVVQTGLTYAEFSLKMIAVPIPLLLTESVIQKDFNIVPVVRARMNDAGNQIKEAITNALFSAVAQSGRPLEISGFNAAIDDGTNEDVYGEISRAANTWWKATYVAPGGTPAPTRVLANQYVQTVLKASSEYPVFGSMGVGTWTLLSQDFQGYERYVVTPESGGFRTAHTAFTSLMVANLPIYCDPYQPEGTFYIHNTRYMGLRFQEDLSFVFSGFESLLSSGQLAHMGVVVVCLELISVKPKATGRVVGLNYLNI